MTSGDEFKYRNGSVDLGFAGLVIASNYKHPTGRASLL
jgi:hypothetical protein